ncbi:MAG: helix-turn-helix domain-containing protein [Lachnospiraceae bacterium]|nr:helix-turn-helix domain-containing protein [Lachnospiraceae bacterium]
MNEKSTKELVGILGKTHLSDFDNYCNDNKDSMNEDLDAFCVYMKELFRQKHMTQQEVFLRADIPERYGYKLLSGEKHTRQRDVLLRICYAGNLSLEETQRALKKYQMPELYAKIPRDALLMIIFNDRPGSIIDVNELLKANGMDSLRTSGLQE